MVRLGAMGDILHALPAVAAMRAAHPEWEIGWAVEPRWSPLLAVAQGSGVRGQGSIIPVRGVLQPLVDRVHFAPMKAWGKRLIAPRTIREIVTQSREVRACHYDAVLDLQGAIKSAVVARLAAAPRVIGEDAPREWAARWLYSERVATRGEHVIEQDLEVAGAVAGERLKWMRPLLPEDPAAEAWCDALMDELGGRPVAMLTPGAGWGAKCWPVERYTNVAQGLSARGMRVLVNCGPGEEALALEIERGTGGEALPVAASIAELIALVRRVALFVGGDTGPLHLACALGRPVVGIYGPTDPGRNGPFGTQFAVLRSPTSRRDHSRRMRPEAGLLTISPDAVLRAADDLLGKEDVR